MRIVADENIPYVREAFAGLGEVTTVHGRKVDRETLRDAELLLVRSITKVNAALLGETPVRFVATATIGEDHVDTAYLKAQGIGFSSAPGCNANSVSEYITAALLVLAERYGFDLSGMSIGIVGVGNVGKRVAAKMRALGLRVVLNDPPLAEATCEPAYRSIEEVLACDIVTLHVPLEKGGAYPTYHLVDEKSLARMKSGAILLNTSRGAVVDAAALKQVLSRSRRSASGVEPGRYSAGELRAAVLDVWEGEPNPDVELMGLVDIASPHIAGYSFDGKVNGTRQIYEAACRFLGAAAAWDPTPLLPAPEVPEVAVDPRDPQALRGAVCSVYDILRDDRDMRKIADLPAAERGAHFDKLRKEYWRRREFQHTRIRFESSALRQAQGERVDYLAHTLSGLGFQVETPK